MSTPEESPLPVKDFVSEPPPKKKSIKRKAVIGGVGIVVVVGTFVFILPRIADYRSVWDVVQDLTWEQIALLVIATILNLATYAPPWMAALPGLEYRQGSVLTLASTASTYVAPGGAAVGMATSFAMLRGWGFAGQPVTIAVAVTGIWNQFAMLGFPIIALAGVTLQHERNSLLQTVAIIGLVVFVVAVAAFAAGLWTERLARDIGDLVARIANWGLRLIHKGPVKWSGISFVRFRNETVRLLGQALARADARHARRPAHGVPRDARLDPGLRRHRRRRSASSRRSRPGRSSACSARCRSHRAGSGSSRSASPVRWSASAATTPTSSPPFWSTAS